MASSRKCNVGSHERLPAHPPSSADIDAWVQLVHAYHRIARRLEQALIPHRLSLAQFEVLARLQFDGAINQNELAQRLLVTKGNVCGLIDRLEAAGFVERQCDPLDRRANRLVLTNRGASILAKALPDHLAIIRESLGVLSASQLRKLRELSQKISEPSQ